MSKRKERVGSTNSPPKMQTTAQEIEQHIPKECVLVQGRGRDGRHNHRTRSAQNVSNGEVHPPNH